MPAEQQLLFGLFALQNGLINQAQLVSAFQAWTLDKGRSLADFLVERGDLDADDRAAVEAMVARHFSKHGDAERSLGALSLRSSSRQVLADLNDPELAASLGHVSQTIDLDGDRTATYTVGEEISDGQRFRVLRPHAQGGLGAVFVALDGELNREVALKQILEQHADNRVSRDRFVIEAEVTGGLEHPGIVPVYGLGTYANGRPYYAMRFIKGDSLKQAIAAYHQGDGAHRAGSRHSLGLHKLLRRFLDVCNALEYAHARGVLHRDIKPGNIIVGKYGETLVVDWGLAKATGKADPASDERTLQPSSGGSAVETLPGRALGTPGYMSPEQARGDLEALGPRSDVYSLGATLYCLLTGRPPFAGVGRVEMLARAQAGEFPPPRQDNPSIDPSLEAICLKAMATAPEGRYGSCRALGEDIERWLSDEPVGARRAPLRERASRWLRKHPVLASAAGAAMLVGLAAALYSLQREQAYSANLKAANVALDVQRKRAEAREELAIEAVKKFRDAVVENPDLKNNPSLEGLRKTLLKEPLAFFRSLRERLQADNDTRPGSLARLAGAAFELGVLTDEIGDRQDALRTYEEALAIRARLARENPAVADFQADLARTRVNIGALLGGTGKPAEALASYEQARAIWERLARENPNGFQRDLAMSHLNIGSLFSDTGKLAEALASYEWARAIYERLARENPTVNDLRNSLAMSHHNIGNLFSRTGKPAEALAAYERALAILERLARERPAVNDIQNSLATCHNSIGLLHSATGKPAEALASHERARALFERLAQENPTVTKYQNTLAMSYNNMGLLLGRTGKPAEALASCEQARVIYERLARENPTVTDFQAYLARSYNNIGLLRSATGQPAEALAAYQRALAILERLARENPTVTQYQSDLAGSHNNVASQLRATGKPAEALAAYERARAIYERLARDHPTVADYLRNQAIGLNNTGRLLSGMGKLAEALPAFEQARAIRERLAREHPTINDFQSDLAASHTDIGNLQRVTGKTVEALASFENARAIWERLAREHPELPEYASSLGGMLHGLAVLDLSAKRFASARDRFREAITWQKKALAASPRHPLYQRLLGDHEAGLWLASLKLGGEAQAAEAGDKVEESPKADRRVQ